MTYCEFPGCAREVQVRQWCKRCYYRLRNNGQIEKIRRPMGACDVPNCSRLRVTATLCRLHYRRLQSNGDPLVVQKRGANLAGKQDPAKRFWSHVDKDSHHGCWVWTAGLHPGGYGNFWLDGRTINAHRYSWELANGPVPDGLHLDHICRNRACVRPDHLEPVTMQMNILRGVSPAALNARKTHCIRGHEFTEENTYRQPGNPNSRICRECVRIRQREHHQRQKSG